MVKPDGVQRGLVGEIIKRFEQKGFKLVGLKMVHASKEHMESHYEDLKEKKFFPGLVAYMTSGPVVGMVWEGKDVIKMGRMLLGATRPTDSAPGTIRGDFAVDVGRNIWYVLRCARLPAAAMQGSHAYSPTPFILQPRLRWPRGCRQGDRPLVP